MIDLFRVETPLNPFKIRKKNPIEIRMDDAPYADSDKLNFP